MSTATKPRPYAHFDQLQTWINELHGEKEAAARGETTHPSKSVDDHTKEVTTGERARENSKDIKKMVVGNAGTASVDGTEQVGKPQDDQQLNIGLRQSSVGKDPSLEDDYKDRPKDSPTTHPASAELGEKYSFDLNSSAGLAKAAAALSELANQIMADIAVGDPTASKQAASPSAAAGVTAPTGTPASFSTPSATPEQAAVAGYELARALGLSKDAADQTATSVVAGTLARASYLADRVGTLFLDLYKQANEAGAKDKPGEPPAASEAEAAAPSNIGGEAVPEAVAGMGAGGDGPPAGMPGAGGMGGPGGGDNTQQALQELSMALMELGISPEQLAQAMQQGQGGMGAGGPGGGMGAGGPGGPGGDMGGGSPAPESPAAMGAKIASEVQHFRRSGKFEVRAAKSAAERKLRDDMKRYINEVLGATRS